MKPTQPKRDNTYSVRSLPDDFQITGKGDNPCWRSAIPLTDFTYPWNNRKHAALTFMALHSPDWLYFLFNVNDDKRANVYVCNNHKEEVVYSDRVEIFFRRDAELKRYYCLEVDPLSRVFDYEAEFHRKFDPAWHWPPSHLRVKSDFRDKGYTVEIAISRSSLTGLGVLRKSALEAGLFRADCLVVNGTSPEIEWVSWLSPDSPTPDFHIPSSFGTLLLSD